MSLAWAYLEGLKHKASTTLLAHDAMIPVNICELHAHLQLGGARTHPRAMRKGQGGVPQLHVAHEDAAALLRMTSAPKKALTLRRSGSRRRSHGPGESRTQRRGHLPQRRQA